METNEAYLYHFVVNIYDYSKNTRGSGPDKILAYIVVFFANIKYLDKTRTVDSAIANDYTVFKRLQF